MPSQTPMPYEIVQKIVIQDNAVFLTGTEVVAEYNKALDAIKATSDADDMDDAIEAFKAAADKVTTNEQTEAAKALADRKAEIEDEEFTIAKKESKADYATALAVTGVEVEVTEFTNYASSVALKGTLKSNVDGVAPVSFEATVPFV